MAEFIGRAKGNALWVTRNGTKASGITVVAQSWHGSLRVRLATELREKPAQPTKPEDILVTIHVEEGTKEYPSQLLFEGRLIDLVQAAENGKRLWLENDEKYPGSY